MLVLLLLKISCHFLGIDKMMCDNEDRWRQDSIAQTFPFAACHRKSSSFPCPGLCSTPGPHPTSEMRMWRGYLAHFLPFFPKVDARNAVQALTRVAQSSGWFPDGNSQYMVESSAGFFCNKRQFYIMDRKYIWGFLFLQFSKKECGSIKLFLWW